MRNAAARLSILMVSLLVVGASGQGPQNPSSIDSPFAGRWEVVVQPPAGSTNPFEGDGIPFAIVELTDSGASLSGKVVDVPAGGTAKVAEVSVKDDQLALALEMSMGPRQLMLRLKGRRVGDHLEGTAVADGEPEIIQWVGRITTKDKLSAPTLRPQTADQKAFTAAMNRPRGERGAALTQFLKDFPDSTQKERASYELALNNGLNERGAAMRKFIADFPNSALREQANLQIALTPTDPSLKAAALREFMAAFPASKVKDQAEYELTLTVPAGPARQAAQEAFVKAYPKSTYASSICTTLIQDLVRAKPVDEARVTALIDIYVNGAPDVSMPAPGGLTMNLRAGRLNTVADRLMVAEVMLDKALDLIQQAVAAAGDKEVPRSRAYYLTTLGQVLYKLKNYDRAERELKHAIELAGADGEGEAQLFLGKVYEARHDADAALAAYLGAAAVSSSKDIKSSLERSYQQKYGSLAGLEDKLDAMYRARPKPFEPGRYTRPATPEPARVVLAELFTGAECGPCVAADLAFDGLAERYDRQTVAVLVYHLHVPGPDPMTNADTVARAKYYAVNATPTVVVDGLGLQAGGGAVAQAAKAFTDYKGKVESRLAAAPAAALTGFRAKLDGQTIAVSGEAALAAGAGDKAKKATLRVALVQDTVRYTGGNGVRFHAFVVRKLLGPAAGTALPAGTKTSFSDSVSVVTLGSALDTYLTGYEKDVSAERGAFAFQDKVTRLDASRMLVVAFVQDDDTKEILQAVVVKAER